MQALSVEIKLKIFSYLPLRDRLVARLVCQHYRDIADDDVWWIAKVDRTFIKFVTTMKVLKDIMNNQKLAPPTQINQIIEYAKKDQSAIPLILAYSRSYLVLINDLHNLFPASITGNNHSRQASETDKVRLIFLQALCKKFIEDMHQYYLCTIETPNIDDITRAIHNINRIENLEDKLFKEKEFHLSLFFRKECNILPVFLLQYSFYESLYQRICLIENMIFDGLLDLDHDITPEKYEDILHPKINFKEAICFVVLEKMKFDQAIWLKENMKLTFNAKHLNNILEKMKNNNTLIGFSEQLKQLGVPVDGTSIENANRDISNNYCASI